MFPFFYDPTFILMLPAMAFAMWAQWKVKSTYEQYSRVRASNGLTGRDMARQIMMRNGVSGVEVQAVDGVLSDHYDPRSRTVRLSAGNYAGDSISSIAVAAHEVGHVLQHQQGYVPLQIRTGITPVVSIATTAAWPLIVIGILMGPRMPFSHTLIDLGIVFFAGAVVFHLITLPVEFDASKRALAELTSTGAVTPQEVAGTKKVLDAAALTYVAAAAVAVLQLVRMLIIRDSRR